MNRTVFLVGHYATFIVGFILPVFAFAQIMAAPINAPSNINNINFVTGSSGLLCVAIDWFFWLLIVATIIFVLYAGVLYLTSAGEPEKVKDANKMLLYAAIAVAVALIAKGLPLIVSGFIGGGLSSTGCGGGGTAAGKGGTRSGLEGLH